MVFGGCDDEVGCTLQLEREVIEIVDQNNNPVSSVELEIINKRTNKALCEAAVNQDQRENCENELGEIGNTGNYVIVTSLNVGRYSDGDVKDGDILAVSGTKSDVSFSQEYTVVTDSNVCHPERIIGPEKIVLDITQ